MLNPKCIKYCRSSSHTRFQNAYTHSHMTIKYYCARLFNCPSRSAYQLRYEIAFTQIENSPFWGEGGGGLAAKQQQLVSGGAFVAAIIHVPHSQTYVLLEIHVYTRIYVYVCRDIVVGWIGCQCSLSINSFEVHALLIDN